MLTAALIAASSPAFAAGSGGTGSGARGAASTSGDASNSDTAATSGSAGVGTGSGPSAGDTGSAMGAGTVTMPGSPGGNNSTTDRGSGVDAANDFAADHLAEPAGDKFWSGWYRAASGLAGCAWRPAGWVHLATRVASTRYRRQARAGLRIAKNMSGSPPAYVGVKPSKSPHEECAPCRCASPNTVHGRWLCT